MPEELLFGDKTKSSEKSLFNESKPAKPKNNIFETSEKKSVSEDDGLFTGEEKPAPKSVVKTKTKKPADPKKRKKIRNIVLACVGALILVTCGVVALMWVLWYNSDEGILASALGNLFLNKDTDIIADGKLKVEIAGEDEQVEVSFSSGMFAKGKDGKFDLSFEASIPQSNWISGKTYYVCNGTRKYNTYSEARADCGWDYEYKYESGRYEYTTEEVSLSGAAIVLDEKGLFFKADLSSIANLLDLDLDDLKDYSKKWIFVSEDYLQELMDEDFDSSELQTCTEEVIKNNSNAQNEMYDILFKSNLFKATAEKPEKRKGDLIRYSVEYSKDVDVYIKFLTDLHSLNIVDGMLDCYADNIDEFDRSIIDEQIEETIETLDGLSTSERKEFANVFKQLMPKTTVVINRSTRQFAGVELRGNFVGAEYKLDMDLKNSTRPDDTIEAPNKYKNLEDIIK